MSHVFISYAREDEEHARQLHGNLSKHGVETWFDREMLLPGQNWRREIKRAIAKSQFFLLLLSGNSLNKRGFVQAEVRQALRLLEEIPGNQIFLVPVRLEECSPHDEELSEIQWVDLFQDYDHGLRQILRSVAPRLEGRASQKSQPTVVKPEVQLDFVEARVQGAEVKARLLEAICEKFALGQGEIEELSVRFSAQHFHFVFDKPHSHLVLKDGTEIEIEEKSLHEALEVCSRVGRSHEVVVFDTPDAMLSDDPELDSLDIYVLFMKRVSRITKVAEAGKFLSALGNAETYGNVRGAFHESCYDAVFGSGRPASQLVIFLAKRGATRKLEDVIFEKFSFQRFNFLVARETVNCAEAMPGKASVRLLKNLLGETSPLNGYWKKRAKSVLDELG